jgi:hypothetical protein
LIFSKTLFPFVGMACSKATPINFAMQINAVPRIYRAMERYAGESLATASTFAERLCIEGSI